jgi:hypothetical protein
MLRFFLSMLCGSKILPFSLENYLGTSLLIRTLMRIRVIDVEWTWLPSMLLNVMHHCCLISY